MSDINELHERAMDLADQAFIAQHRGDQALASALSQEAFELESQAADLLKDDLSAEPTRSVLYRSAASLAIDVGDSLAAEHLIAIALAGNPPRDIADELLNLLEQVSFHRHLDLHQITLDPDEFQFSIAGKAIGYGIALSGVFVERIKDMERLIYRTVERKLGKEFRERGSTQSYIQEGYSLYIGAPRPGSFAVTLRLGRQMGLPNLDVSPHVIDEILDCFALLNDGSEDELKAKIPEEPYFQNFVGLAKRIAPDGDVVSLVGLTATRNGREIKVVLTRPQSSIQHSAKPDVSLGKSKRVSVKGRLLLADATKAERKIKLVDEKGYAHTVIVPEGMMNDIVKPLWDDTVVVSGIRDQNKLYLEDINPARE
jgi:hypothetical protein